MRYKRENEIFSTGSLHARVNEKNPCWLHSRRTPRTSPVGSRGSLTCTPPASATSSNTRRGTPSTRGPSLAYCLWDDWLLPRPYLPGGRRCAGWRVACCRMSRHAHARISRLFYFRAHLSLDFFVSLSLSLQLTPSCPSSSRLSGWTQTHNDAARAAARRPSRRADPERAATDCVAGLVM